MTKKKDANWKCRACGKYHVLSTKLGGHAYSCIDCKGLGTLEPIKKPTPPPPPPLTGVKGIIMDPFTKIVECAVCGKPSAVLHDTLSPFLCIHCGLAKIGLSRDRPKDKTGKYQPHLVCSSLTEAVARVREYGVKKYKGEDGWKQQTPMDYMDAVGRHYDKCRNDPRARDDESGLLHICQIATDAMFIIDMLVKEGVDIAAMKEPDGGQ